MPERDTKLDEKLEAAGLPPLVSASSLSKADSSREGGTEYTREEAEAALADAHRHPVKILPDPQAEPEPDQKPEPFVAPGNAPLIWAAMANAKRDIRAVGKDRLYNAAGTRYNFRGVDDVINAVSPALARWGITMGFTVEWLKRDKFQTRNGGDSWHVTARVRYHFIGLDESTHTVVVEAEANDTADKGTGKVMSVAYRIMLLQVFSIPTDDQDPDAERIELGVAGADAPGLSSPVGRWLRGRLAAARNKAALDALWTLVAAAGAEGHIPPGVHDGSTWVDLFGARLEEIEAKQPGPPPAQQPSGEDR